MYSTLLIGIFTLDPTTTRVSVGNQDKKEKWCKWMEKNPSVSEEGMMHMKTKTGSPLVGRVSKKDEDHMFMYTVSNSVNLENHSITVRFDQGSMGFIANGVVEIIGEREGGREGGCVCERERER